jgi:regulator of replication initiation timing
MRTVIAAILIVSVIPGCAKTNGGDGRQVSELSQMVHEARSKNAGLTEECGRLRMENERLKREYEQLKSDYEHLKQVYNLSKAVQRPQPDKSSGIYEEVFR